MLAVDKGAQMRGSHHAGRPRNTPAAPLGLLVTEQLSRHNLSLDEFAQRLSVSRTTAWRLLNGRVAASRRITVEMLCDALMLNGSERDTFAAAVAQHVKHAHLIGSNREGDGISAGGPHVGMSGNASEEVLDENQRSTRHDEKEGCNSPRLLFGWFLRDQMGRKNISQSRLARTLGVAPSTISRLTRGQLTTTHAVDADRLCGVLSFNSMDRRTFFSLAAQACLLPIVYHVSPAHLRFRAFEKSLDVSLAAIEEVVGDLRRRRNNGDVATVYQRAKELFDSLFNRAAPVTDITRFPELARAKLLIGFEFCEAQAAHLDWYDRAPCMIQTLTRMEDDVLLRFPVKAFAPENGHLLNVRGPLYYKLPQAVGREDGYSKCIQELSSALESERAWYDEPTLRIELLRNRAHAYLLRAGGKLDQGANEGKWRGDLEQATNVAYSLQQDTQGQPETFRALVEYSWGEGYKRLAYFRGTPAPMRRQYLERALKQLAESAAVFDRYHRWEGYALLAEIARAQCVTLLDADEGLRRVERLRPQAMTYYPALLAKIDRTAARARRMKELRVQHEASASWLS